MRTREVGTGARRSTLILCDGPRDFADAVQTHAPSDAPDRVDHWTGSSRNAADLHARRGDETHVAAAEALLRQIEAHVDIPARQWMPSPCGAYPIVPEFLAGRPDPMRRAIVNVNESAPVRICIDLVSSAGIDHGKLTKRGIGFLALCMALARQRPIEATAVMPMGARSGRGGIVVIPLQTAPLDVAALAGVLTDPGVTRDMGYDLLRKLAGGNGNWYADLNPIDDKAADRYVAAVREAIGFGDRDIYIRPAYLTDPLVDDPVGFINKIVRRCNGEAV